MYSFVGDGLFIGGVGDRALFEEPILGRCTVDPAIVLMFCVCMGSIGLKGIIGKGGMPPGKFWLMNIGLKNGNGIWSCCVGIG